jgi:hypothetical protein
LEVHPIGVGSIYSRYPSRDQATMGKGKQGRKLRISAIAMRRRHSGCEESMEECGE